MKILGKEIKATSFVPSFLLKNLEPEAYLNQQSDISYPLWNMPFSGEKTPYELGEPINYYIEYYLMRERAWEAFLKSDVVQNAIKKYCLWVIGAGLKLQSEPVFEVLKKFNISVTEKELAKFSEDSESQFRLFAGMTQSTWSEESCLHELACEDLKNAILSGDILCILRFDGKYPKMETIDGIHIQTPIASDHLAAAENRGNEIIEGVEIDKKGSHVAYYIRQDDFTFNRIEAYGANTSQRQAWLFYGQKFKKSSVRGMSLLAAIIEAVSKMDRYKEATITSAEENANIIMTIEHNQFSDGENPLIESLAQSMGKDKGTAPETDSYTQCDAKATKISQHTSGEVINMPTGSKLERHNGSSDPKFAEFYGVNAELVYAIIGIPPEVAADKFGGAYSGSRAALKSWEYKILVDRTTKLKRQYYKPFYDFWLNINVSQNNISANGYLKALFENDHMVLEAYRNSRFIGATVPHIDPEKEAKAMRVKLGKGFENVPLDTISKVMEELNSGDMNAIIKKLQNEKELFKDFIGPTEPKSASPVPNS